MFDEKQISSLEAKLDAQHIKQRKLEGRNVTLSYIEGWWAIHEANRIFGHDCWDRETVQLDCTWSGKRPTRSGEKDAASYIARVRVTVRAGGEIIVREGVGSGSGFGADVGEAHESAAKEAETDAMKRALVTFGNPFGLALYDKQQRDVDHGGHPPLPKGPKGGKKLPGHNKSTLFAYSRHDTFPFPKDRMGVSAYVDKMCGILEEDAEAWEPNASGIQAAKDLCLEQDRHDLIKRLGEIEVMIGAA